MEDMQKDVVLSDLFNQFFDPTEKVVEKKKKKKDKAPKKAEVSPKVSLEDRQEAGVDETKCLCRIWKNGLDNVQCSRNKKEGDFCKAHFNKGAGEWWLGLVTEARPEEPVGPYGSTKASRHYWTGQDQPEKKSRKKSEPVEEELVVISSEVVAEVVAEVLSDMVSEVVSKSTTEVVEELVEDIITSSMDKDVGSGVGYIQSAIVRTPDTATVLDEAALVAEIEVEFLEAVEKAPTESLFPPPHPKSVDAAAAAAAATDTLEEDITEYEELTSEEDEESDDECL